MSDNKQPKIEDLEGEAQDLTPEQAEGAQGGLILPPPIQPVRDPARQFSTSSGNVTTGGALLGDGSVRNADGSV